MRMIVLSFLEFAFRNFPKLASTSFIGRAPQNFPPVFNQISTVGLQLNLLHGIFHYSSGVFFFGIFQYFWKFTTSLSPVDLNPKFFPWFLISLPSWIAMKRSMWSHYFLGVFFQLLFRIPKENLTSLPPIEIPYPRSVNPTPESRNIMMHGASMIGSEVEEGLFVHYRFVSHANIIQPKKKPSMCCVFKAFISWGERPLTHLCPPLRSTFAVRETASLGIMGAPRVPP